MTTRRKYDEKELMYFCTFTCHNWLPLIDYGRLCGEIKTKKCQYYETTDSAGLD